MARKKYKAEEIIQILRTFELEAENQRLKKIVADLSVDNQILKEVTKGNF